MSGLWVLADLTPESRTTLLEALVILMVLVVAGGFGIMLIRRRLNADDESEASAGFSLAELKEMRDRGEITSEEYETTKRRVIDKVKANLAAAENKGKGTGGFPVIPPEKEEPS
jgi:hypothetical protein